MTDYSHANSPTIRESLRRGVANNSGMIIMVGLFFAAGVVYNATDIVESWLTARQETVLPGSVMLKGDCGPARPEDAQKSYAKPKGCTVTLVN